MSEFDYVSVGAGRRAVCWRRAFEDPGREGLPAGGRPAERR